MLAELAADRARPAPRSNYELFNCNNFNIRYWSWNYRGCWPLLPGGGDPPPSPRALGDERSLIARGAPLSKGGNGLYLRLAPI